MFPSQEALKIPWDGEDAAERPFPPELLTLKRYGQFCQFLRDELETCRTETETEVVLSALVKAQMQIQGLEKRLGLLCRAEA